MVQLGVACGPGYSLLSFIAVAPKGYPLLSVTRGILQKQFRFLNFHEFLRQKHVDKKICHSNQQLPN
jgi:hypothetical protein